NMKQDQIVTAKAQWCDGVDHRFRLLVEIRQHHDNSAPPQELLEMNERLREIRMSPELCFLYRMSNAHELALASRGRHIVSHLVVEHNHARRVALLVREICQRNGQKASVIELGYPVRAVAHRCAGIEHQRQLAVGFATIALQIRALGSSENIP